MSAALTIVDESPQYSRQQLDILKRTIAADLNDMEFGLLVEVSRRTGLDLFARQLYGIKRGGKMTLQTGIDGYRLMAARTGALAGIDDAIYDDESGKHPGRASVTVWRFVQGQRVPFTATARWSEYASNVGGMWEKMPYLMLAKCAEALALRKAFPAELSGVYTGEEMAQADNEPGPIVDVSRETGEIVREKATPRAAPAMNKAGLVGFLADLKALGITPAIAMEELGVKTFTGLDYAAALAKLKGEAKHEDAQDFDLRGEPFRVPA